MKKCILIKIYTVFVFLFIPTVSFSRNSNCTIPRNIKPLVSAQGLSNLMQYPDVKRNAKGLKDLCVHLISFNEGPYRWDMLLVTNPKASHRAFWFLPHDDENSAFDSAVYAVRKYGGGFLSVLNNGKRYHSDQDPNRNFSYSKHRSLSCIYQKHASPKYTKTVFAIIDTYKKRSMPYLALHNNTNGGGVSILKSSKNVKSYPAYPIEMIRSGRGLKDEDSLIYMAGKSSAPSRNKLNTLLANGINVKYEIVNLSNNDCSMSNYVVLGKKSNNYYNIEAQHGDGKTQRKMIDILMEQIMR